MLKQIIMLVITINIAFSTYVSMRCPLQQYVRSTAIQVIEVYDNNMNPDCNTDVNLRIIGPETNLTVSDRVCYSSGENFFNYTVNTTGLFTLSPIITGVNTTETCKILIVETKTNTVPSLNVLSIMAVVILCGIVMYKKK